MFNILNSAYTWLFLKNLLLTLSITTIIVAIIGGWVYYRNKGKDKIFILVVSLSVIVFSLISSYHILLKPVDSFQKAFSIVGSSILFIIVLFLKLLFFSWIVALIGGLFKPDRILEFGAKIFGMEISHKYAPEEQINKLETGIDKVQIQLDIISKINAFALEYLGGPFEDNILKSKNQADKIRQTVKDVLLKVYYQLPNIKVYVISLNDTALNTIPEKLAAIVRLLFDESVNIVQVENKTIGIGIHQGSEELGTIIIIDATDELDYEVSLAEICAISNFFVSITTVIDWAKKAK